MRRLYLNKHFGKKADCMPTKPSLTKPSLAMPSQIASLTANGPA